MNAVKPEGLRVVLDTNIYISAFSNASGIPFQIWQHAIKRRYILLISPAIIRELADVLRTDFSWSEPEILSQLKLLARTARVINPRHSINIITDDPDDNRILECAMEGRADLIVSGDRHLTRVKAFRGVGIVRPADFKRTLGF
jgi:putative PIN family toxin of toxin-antitoxin system